jgi:hypothetical protein
MKGDNEHKNNVHRLINSTSESKQKKVEVRSKSPVRKFTYQLPKSFFKAVDDARLEAGYDVLPRFHHLSISPSPHCVTPLSSSSSTSSAHRSIKHHDHQTGPKHAHSLSTSNNKKAPPKKVRFRQTTGKHSHHHKKEAQPSSANSKASHRS